MIEILSYLSPIFLIGTLILSIFVVGGVFINKFNNESTRKTYPKWRIVLLYIAMICGYVGGSINEYLVFEDDVSSLSNLIIVIAFYVASTIVITIAMLKNPDGTDERGQEIDYRNVQFFIILVVGLMPIILLSY